MRTSGGSLRYSKSKVLEVGECLNHLKIRDLCSWRRVSKGEGERGRLNGQQSGQIIWSFFPKCHGKVIESFEQKNEIISLIF